MPLTAARLVTGQTAYAADVKQFYDLLTGVMADQPVTFGELVTCAKASGIGLTVAAGAFIQTTLTVGSFLAAASGSFSGRLASTTDGSGGGFEAGAALDALLYRGAADMWYTGAGDGLLVNGSLEAAGVFKADTSIQLGAGAVVTKLLSATATWDPGSIANGATDYVNVTVAGAAVGDPAFVGYTSITSGAWLLTGHVEATDTVHVVAYNKTGGDVDLGSGTVRAIVFHI